MREKIINEGISDTPKINSDRLKKFLEYDKIKFEKRKEKIKKCRKNANTDQKEAEKEADIALEKAWGKATRDVSLNGNDSKVSRKSLRESIRSEKKSGAEHGSDDIEFRLGKEMVNKIMEREYFSDFVDAAVDSFNEGKSQIDANWRNHDFESLFKGDYREEFITFVKEKGTQLVEDNRNAAISESSAIVLNEILGTDNVEDEEDKNIKKREGVISDILNFVETNNDALIAFNSQNETVFKNNFGISKKELLTNFSGLFPDVKALPSVKKQKIDRLFSQIAEYCEQSYVEISRFQKSAEVLMTSKDNDQDWENTVRNQNEKMTKEMVEQEHSTQSQATTTGGEGRLNYSSNYYPVSSVPGCHIDDGGLDIDALRGFGYKPPVTIDTLNGGVRYHIFDKYSGEVFICRPHELPYYANKLTLSFLVNEGINQNDQVAPSVKRDIYLNNVFNDKMLYEIALNIDSDLTSRVLEKGDYALLKKILEVVINDDPSEPYMSERARKFRDLTVDRNCAQRISNYLIVNPIGNMNFSSLKTIAQSNL